jgi:D-3-phosphoglycerate dehydrogenase
MSRILITPRSLTAEGPAGLLTPLQEAGFELVYSAPGRQPSEAELIDLVTGCTGWLAGVEPITEPVLDAADRLRVISRNGSGIDSIDLAAAERHGINIRTAKGANAVAVSELTLAFMLIGLRHAQECASALKSGDWFRVEGREIGGATVGIIGCGAVGRAAARMTGGLGATVLAYDIAPDSSFEGGRRFAWCGLDELLARSDIVSLHCPAMPKGAPLLDARRLAMLKSGTGLVNTARASLIDEDALLAALEEGRVGWFATDVFTTEPPPPSPFLAHPRVVATPHIGGFTVEGGRAAIRVAVENLIAELAPKQNANKGIRAQA